MTSKWEDASTGARRFAGGGEGEAEVEMDKERVRLRGDGAERAPEEDFKVDFVAGLEVPGVILDPDGIGAPLDFESVLNALGTGDNFDVEKPLAPGADDLDKPDFIAETPAAPGVDDEELALAPKA